MSTTVTRLSHPPGLHPLQEPEILLIAHLPLRHASPKSSNCIYAFFQGIWQKYMTRNQVMTDLSNLGNGKENLDLKKLVRYWRDLSLAYKQLNNEISQGFGDHYTRRNCRNLAQMSILIKGRIEDFVSNLKEEENKRIVQRLANDIETNWACSETCISLGSSNHNF